MAANDTYFGCGLAFTSELKLPMVPRCFRRPSVTVGSGAVPETDLSQPGSGKWFRAEEGQLLFHVPGVARYAVVHGSRILIDPVGRPPVDKLQRFLLGPAFTALLHQRGTTPLHGSSVMLDNAHVLLLGTSGSARSALALLLALRGLTMVADGICPVRVLQDDSVVADVGFGPLHFSDATKHLLSLYGAGAELPAPLSDPVELARKRFCSSEDIVKAGGRSIRAIYIPEHTDDVSEQTIEKLTAADALSALLRYTAQYPFVDGLGATEHHFDCCLCVSRNVPVFRLRLHRDQESLRQTLPGLEEHLYKLRPSTSETAVA